MLVLSRKESQRIRLGDSIVITVVRVAGDKVRLGIEAPRDLVVLRDELGPLETEPLKSVNLEIPSDSLHERCGLASGQSVSGQSELLGLPR
jgi:carbon storage regulator